MNKIVFCMCGSFCNHASALVVLEELAAMGFDITPVLSEHSAKYDTRFGRAAELLDSVRSITGKSAVTDIVTAEATITGKGFSGGVICPCTGNTLSKLKNGVTDTSVTMAAKCLLRNNLPLLIALATNDALGASFGSLAELRNRKNFNFVPVKPDDMEKKPNSMVCDFTKTAQLARRLFWDKVGM